MKSDSYIVKAARRSLLKLRNWSWDFKILSFLQFLFTVDQEVDSIDQKLDQLHLNTNVKVKNTHDEKMKLIIVCIRHVQSVVRDTNAAPGL